MDIIERAARALAKAKAQRPYGGYDYGHNEAFYGPAPEAGRYVIRAEFAHSGHLIDEIVHQTNDNDAHEWEVHRKLLEGNIFYGSLSRARVDSVYDEGD